MEKALYGHVDYQISESLDKHLNEEAHSRPLRAVEFFVENKILFASRWIIAPGYVVLTALLGILCYKAGEEFYQLIKQMVPFDHSKTLLQSFIVVEIILSMNVVLMVVYVGYTNFVSKIHPIRLEDWPEWTRHMDYSGLKVQLLGSIIAISAIILLSEIIKITEENAADKTRVSLLVAIHMTLVISALVIAWVNKLTHIEGRNDTNYPGVSSLLVRKGSNMFVRKETVKLTGECATAETGVRTEMASGENQTLGSEPLK